MRTEIQQPAIFLVSVATWSVLTEQGIRPVAVAGHSLGEYSALVAAGSLGFEQGLALTRRRGELMAEVGARTGGIMAAILGLAPDEVEAVCTESAHAGVVEVANFNSPSQTVISGEEAAVTLAMETARSRGAQRAIRLQVSAPFHCSLMAPLASAFDPELQHIEFSNPQVPVVANVTADYERDACDIRPNLVKQLASSVRWSGSVQRLIADGFDSFVEVGPGKVLTGLMRAIDPSVTAYRTDDLATLQKTVSSLQ
jgi:[acyl-carrier-protein] S-malonyltransferase